MVIIDTSVIIDHLRQVEEKKETALLRLAKKYPKQALSLSTISIQELYEGKSTLKEEKENLLLATIAPLTIFPYTYEVSKLAGELARDLKEPIEFADAAIAASAIINEADLYTLDKKHFKNIHGLQFLKF